MTRYVTWQETKAKMRHIREARAQAARDITSGCALLDQDVSTVLDLSWAIRTQRTNLWTSSTYEPPDPVELDEFDPADYLLIVGDNIKVLEGASGNEIVRSAADEVATEIMDRLNRPWPEAPGAGVLEIALVADELFWCHGPENVCHLGDLEALAAVWPERPPGCGD